MQRSHYAPKFTALMPALIALGLFVACGAAGAQTGSGADNDVGAPLSGDPPPANEVQPEIPFQPHVTPIYAGQTINVGTVFVSNTETELKVFTGLQGSWVLEELHIYAGKDPVPTNGGGNPMVGQFPYQFTFNNLRTAYSTAIPLANIDDSLHGGDIIYVAVHATVKRLNSDGVVVQTEGAWAWGPMTCPGNQWEWFFPYEIQGDS